MMNRNELNRIVQHRYGLVFILAALAVIVSFVTRLVLLGMAMGSTRFTFFEVIELIAVGAFYDIAAASYYVAFFALLMILLPGRWIDKKWFKYAIGILLYLNVVFLLFNGLAEFLFWDEFNTRFNFIAVDYLVYTTEVIGNIRQSYPMEWIIAIVLASAAALYFPFRKIVTNISIRPLGFKKRVMPGVALCLLPFVFFVLIPRGDLSISANNYTNELAENGLYQLFAAYRNNEIDFDRFYNRMDDAKAFALVRKLLKTPDAEFTDSNNAFNLERIIHAGNAEKHLNVVLISIESFSAAFMEAFGNTEKITPHLDSLANESLFFTNLYATGTRTVRGLEALALCIPPTPGQSIVRRPDNENLFSLGKIFDEKGYSSQYIYGGYGYFDNMNYFFSENGYTVHDRVEIPKEEIDYENIWGVADEDLFDLALREINKTVEHQPVFAHIMTTSNHRPYTYPEGRIDIPSHTGRAGAVKYTDYAIDQFLKKARKTKWFKNTVFVIVADHCASSAGKAELPVDKYHIPMMIYSPQNITPAKVDLLMSQIDIGPTVLGLLNFSYKSKFLGFDIFKVPATSRRVFVSTYQKLGFVKSDTLVVLEPQSHSKMFHINLNDYKTEAVEKNQKLMNEAIAWYQVSSYSFKHKLYR